MTSMDYELDLSGLHIVIDPVKALKPFYKITQKLSKGGYGAVFLAEDRNKRQYAVKVQKLYYKAPMLRHERNILDRLYLADPKCFPKVFNYLPLKGHEFLVMQRMGCSLRDLLQVTPSGRLSKKTALMFGIQAIKRLQTMHANHVLHRDIKPGNFVIGLLGREGTISVIDFGISMIVDDWKTYNPEGPSEFHGTAIYAATEALAGEKPTRAGDLESLVYTIIEMFTGELPFSFPTTKDLMYDTIYEQIAQRQQKTVEDLCVNFPDLITFTRLVFAIKRSEEPNYNGLIRELERVLKRNGYQNDARFEWM